MMGRYRRAGETAAQIAFAGALLLGLLGSACLVGAFVLALTLATT